MERSERWFLQILAALVGQGGRVVGLQQRVGFVELTDQTLAVVIWPSLEGEALRARLGEVLALDRQTHLKLVLIGGDAAMIDVLRAAQPRFLARRMVQVFHLADDGQVWAGRRSPVDSPLGAALAQVGRDVGPADIDRADLVSLLPEAPDPRSLEAMREHQTFVTAYSARVPWLTYALLAVIGIVFALEVAFGGSDFVPTLTRMGANTGESLSGEPWRLLASAWLHGGALHVAANAFVLWSLGGFVERILGPARMLVVFVLAALFGSVASALTRDALVSVGASGAIWGFLGLAGVLAFRPRGVVPAAVASSLRRVAVMNFLINVAISFQPGIDWTAHLGGGLAGVLWGFFGPGVSPRPILGMRVAAWVCGIVALGSLIVALVLGTPWRLAGPPKNIERHLPRLGVHIEVPALLGEPVSFGTLPGDAVSIGNIMTAPVEVTASTWPHPQGDLSAPSWDDPAWFYDMALDPPAFGTLAGTRSRVEGVYPAFEESYRFPNGLRSTVRYHLRPDAIIMVDVSSWDDMPPVWAHEVARIHASLRP